MTKSATPTLTSRACYLCGGLKHHAVPGKVRDLPTLGIRQCADCGLVFLENFDHIQPDYYDRIYPKAKNEPTDWNEFLNECERDDARRAEQILPLVANRRFIDVGCGAGGLLLKLKDHCRDVNGIELQSRWRDALKTKGIHTFSSIDEVKDESADVVGLFHVLEHLPDPLSVLRSISKKVIRNGTLVIEVPNADDALLRLYESKSFSEFTYWSPHLYLFTPQTLDKILRKAGFARFQIQQFQRYPLSNHLMWLSKGQPGGHQKWSFLDTPALNQAYADRLASIGYCDTLLAWVTLP